MLSRKQWESALAKASPPTFGEVCQVLAESDTVAADPRELVESALQAGVLAEDVDDGLGHVYLAPSDHGGEERHEDALTADETEFRTARELADEETDTDVVERAHEAFAVAVDYFADQLDRELPGDDTPETAGDYYREVRGWTDETIEKKRLGYAPADPRALRDHLMSRGFDLDAILGTGLFYPDENKGAHPHFRGRYVLPYFDGDGRPVYAISRSLNEHSGGHPADHHGEQKYTKAVKSKEYSHVDEPIYGAETVDDGTDRLLVAGGIADAITLHEAGYACISPVTTVRFKQRHETEVAGLLDRHGIDEVYIVNDAERPTADVSELEDGATAETISDVLTIQQYGEGLRGAFGNVEFLENAGVTPHLVTLPAGDDDLRKLDPDDYVQENWGSVETLLASAKPACEHPGYTGWYDRRQDRAIAEARDSRRDHANRDGGSALFDLTIEDVTGLSVGDRTDNPLGHHGKSHEYYVVVEKDGDRFGYDHKYNVAYNGLLHLLCAAGERRADNPGGRLSDDELLAVWVYAKDNRHLPDDDPIPYRCLKQAAVKSGVLNREEFVEREGDDGGTYEGFPDAETYNAALDAVRDDYGVEPGREPATGRAGDDGDREYRTDPREVDVVIEPRRAWDAAGRVTPDQLDEALPLDTTDDGEAWVCPSTGARVDDVARAVAIAENDGTTAETPLRDEYALAYQRARDRYGAPLPRYYTHADTVERFDYVIGAIRELTFWHLDRDALTAEITGEGSGDVALTLDPTPVDGWRDSKSGESVLVFESGTVWDADGNDGDGQVIDALRFVALDAGLIDDPTESLKGETFTEAYRVARENYGAPLPRWNPGTPTATPVLPPADQLVEAPEPDEDELGRLRGEVEALHREIVDDGAVAVNRSLPALGKTTAAIKSAAGATRAGGDGIPTTYLAPRRELMAQAAETADEWGATYRHLPTFSEADPADNALIRAVAHVREHGKDTLRSPWGILDAVGGEVWPDVDEEDEGKVELDRPTCPTAEGDHGDAWALAVHVARELDYAPRDIHERATALFGRPLPCQESGDCRYSEGWDDVADPDAPVDLLIGFYIHAHVESARTLYRRTPTGGVSREPRALVLDEFPGLVYTEKFGDEALDHAVWLASALRDDVEDRQDLAERDLWGDEFVRAWLDGKAGYMADGPAADVDLALLARRKAHSAAATATEILDRYPDLLDSHDLREPLRRVSEDVSELSKDERRDLANQILTATVGLPEDVSGRGVLRWIEDDVGGELEESANFSTVLPDGVLPESGELREFVDRATEAAENQADGAVAMLEAARTAVRGGDDGARELAVWADDGYAHRKAHYLLEAAIRPLDEAAAKIETCSYTFGDEEGTTIKRVRVRDKTTVLFDRNHRGAEIHEPPARAAGDGELCPVVGLDATARAPLWSTALGESVDVRDVHETARERAECLRDVHRLQIVQATDQIRSYEGDPAGKNLDRDVALLQEIEERFSGVHAPRGRGEEPIQVGKPVALTTKVVRHELENDERLADVVGTWAHYGNVKGSNDLGGHQLAALLGSQHFGDAAVERFAAIAGEQVRRSGYGHALDYDSDVANTYLNHMREDQVMQAALRFTRGGSGALVFAHTAALRDDLPIVGEAKILETWSDTATKIADAWRRAPGASFTAADVADAVDVGARQVRRVLAEFVDAGYLQRHDPGEGLANEHTPTAQPTAGEVDLGPVTPEIEAEAGQAPLEEYYTANVRVTGVNPGEYPRVAPPSSSLPAPDTSTAAAAGPPPS